MRGALKRIVALVMVCQLMGIGLPQAVHAVLISTSQVLEESARAGRLARVDRLLASEDVQKKFVELRVASLTDAELVRLEAGLDSLLVGGDSALAVLGIVFLVLLILEIVGVTNIFNKI